jgi:hypothetical protein
MEDYNPEYYEGFERRVAGEIAQDEASIGEVDTSLRLDPCEGCPLFDFPIDEAVKVWEGAQASTEFKGLKITTQYETADGRQSSEIVLGRHDSNSIGGKRKAKIYEEAAKRTIECEGPKKVPRFLGPLAVKKCPALEGRKTRKPDFIGR